MSSSSQGDMYPHIALDQAKLKATFKTPSISNRSAFVASGGLDTSRGLSSSTSVLGPSKRRRLLPDGTYVYESHADGAPPGEGNSPAGTSRLGAVNARGAGSPAAAEASVPAKSSGKPQVYECTWRKPQYKKHKTWDGDAYLLVYPDKRLAVMKCIDTRAELARSGNWTHTSMEEDNEYSIGGKDIQLGSRVPYAKYCSVMEKAQPPLSLSRSNSNSQQPQGHAQPTSTASTASYLRETQKQFQAPARVPLFYGKKARQGKSDETEADEEEEEALLKQAKTETERQEAKRSVSPHKLTGGLLNPGQGKSPHARYNTETPNAILMKRPDKAHQKKYNPKGLPIVDVVIDPNLGKHLRPHQVKGVQFMYECVMGMSEPDANGAILADEMGLGKTLQTITLIHTLLKQSCYYFPGSHTIQKALVVCPLSLVKNWKREFRKWLGTSSINVLCIDGDKRSSVKSFLYSKTYSVMIIGYEKLRTCMNELKDAQPPIDLIVCDEGHRLKSKDAKTTKMFEALSTPRRVILSGTPIQNDLSEFYAMVDFVCPGLLGDRNTFKKVFEDPIMKSRVQHCRKEDLENGKHRSEMLQTATQKIILRRTAELLSDYLKPKTEMVVFCAPSQLQLQIYEQIVGAKQFKRSISAGSFHNPLPYILTLRKLCNAPSLLLRDSGKEEEGSVIYTEECQKLLKSQGMRRIEMSGKLAAVDKLVKLVHKSTDDKIVIVSNFTSTLDILEDLCDRRGWSTLRLDGKTKQDTRQELVNDFNRSSQESSFIFLLSAKSGGVGLNLIGANRLILYDSDWNPSTDKQAMARIHRDGQMKPCFIYRMLLAGSMDEKIYQRQLSKIGLSDSLMNNGGNSSKASDAFTTEELRDIFTLHKDTCALTHDLLHCDCGGTGKIMASDAPKTEVDDDSDDDDEPPATFVPASQVDVQQMSKASKDKRAKLAALFTWGHFDCREKDNLSKLRDTIVRDVALKQHGLGAAGIATPPEAKPVKKQALLELLDDPSLFLPSQEAPSASGPFDVTKVKSGAILHVFEKNSRTMATTPVESDNDDE